MKIWGITGTNGKTTTTWVLADFLNAAYITTVEAWTLKKRFSTGYTTPPYVQLKAIFAEMEESGAHDCVMEVSSHAMHQNRMGDDTHFSGGGWLNISQDHLDYHKTMEEYFRVKLSFAARVAHDTPGAPFAVALEGLEGERIFHECKKIPNLDVIGVSTANTRYDLSRLRLLGDFNKQNVLVAAALAEKAGVSPEEIQRKIDLLRPRWGRMEEVETASRAAHVFVDYAHTPDGIEKAIEASRSVTKGKLWIVFGAGGNRDKTKRAFMGDIATIVADKIVLTSDNPRNEDPMAIIADILKGVCSNYDNVMVEPDRRNAIAKALDEAQEDDTVLICGKGHETTQEIAGVKYPFDDRQTAREWNRT